MHIGGYNITLEQIILNKQHMADMYAVAARPLSGDKKELLLRLAAEENESAVMLTKEYERIFCCLPHLPHNSICSDTTVKELIHLEARWAAHIAHLSKRAPNKAILNHYNAMVQNAVNHGYLLLLII